MTPQGPLLYLQKPATAKWTGSLATSHNVTHTHSTIWSNLISRFRRRSFKTISRPSNDTSLSSLLHAPCYNVWPHILWLARHKAVEEHKLLSCYLRISLHSCLLVHIWPCFKPTTTTKKNYDFDHVSNPQQKKNYDFVLSIVNYSLVWSVLIS
jgi:hypothetical protein